MGSYGTQTPNAELTIQQLLVDARQLCADLKQKHTAMDRMYERVYEKEKVPGSLMAPAYNATIPIILFTHSEDCATTIFESRAITEYVTIMRDEGRIYQWVESESQNLSCAASPLLYETFRSRKEKRPVDENIKATSLINLGKVLDVYEVQLSKHQYLAGDSYSSADVVHAPLFYLIGTLDAFAGVLDNRPHVKAWVADISSNSGFKKVTKMD